MGNLTLHFDAEEFNCSTDQDRQNYYMLCLLLLEHVRDRFGVVKVTSGKRSAEEQEKLKQRGYSPSNSSQHLLGEACDFTCPYATYMGQVYVFIIQDMQWAGEVIWYKRRGHIHVGLPRYNVKADHFINETD